MLGIERALAPLFPGWAARRAEARVKFDMLTRNYEGAKVSRRTQGWFPSNATADTLLDRQLDRLRNRSRDLVRNNPYAAGGLDVLVAYQVGTGIIPRSNTGDLDLDKKADALFGEWSAACDIVGTFDFHGLIAHAARTRSEAGETLVRKVKLSTAEMTRLRTPVPLALQLLEPEFLDILKDVVLDDGKIRHGVETDLWGRVRAYWLYDHHPGEYFTVTGRAMVASTRFPAAEILHLYRADRPGQLRGVPDLSPVLNRLRMLDDYEDATFEQARIQACLAAFVTSDAGAGRGPLEGPVQDGTGQQRKTLAPGIIERLKPGEDVKFLSPPPANGFSEFARHQLRAVAQGYGIPYMMLTGDLAEANYSSMRAGFLPFRRRIEQAQWLMLVPRLCDPLYQAFAEAAQLVGKLPQRQGPWPVRWSPPRFEFVDPVKDAEALIAEVRAGFKTWDQAVAEMGWDPKAQLAEIAAWNAAAKAAGVILDTDPRYINNAGAAQDPAQNAKVQLSAP
jgi:lambda family phage portal protein